MLNLELFDDKKVLDPGSESQRPLLLRLSAAFRTLPDVFIVGAQKAGTSSLYKFLLNHPNIVPSKYKEHYFFHNSNHYKRGLNFYRSGFATKFFVQWKAFRAGSVVHSIDATANYFEFPIAAKRIANDFPQAKVIVLLRNPVERAWSHYKMARRLGFEKADFNTALRQEEERIEWGAGNGIHNYAFQRLAYRSKGVYIDFLPEWMLSFKSDQLLVLQSEKLFQNPAQYMQNVFDFIGIENRSGIQFPHINLDPEGLKIPEDARIYLKGFYQSHNRNLFEFLKEQYDWE